MIGFFPSKISNEKNKMKFLTALVQQTNKQPKLSVQKETWRLINIFKFSIILIEIRRLLLLLLLSLSLVVRADLVPLLSLNRLKHNRLCLTAVQRLIRWKSSCCKECCSSCFLGKVSCCGRICCVIDLMVKLQWKL